MILPGAVDALITRDKVVDYLLNAAHPDNRGKAAFFTRWGFLASNSSQFQRAVREMILHAEVVRRIESAWGEKFVIDGTLKAPGGLTPMVRTIWIIDKGAVVPRMVTAYPRT